MSKSRIFTTALFLSGHLAVWVTVFFLLSPIPLQLGLFRYSALDDPALTGFLAYSFAFNALLIYTYAHFALPVYQLRGRVGYFLLANMLYVAGFALIESPVDYFFLQQFGREAEEGSFAFIIRFNLVSNMVMMMAANMYGFTYAWFRDRQIQQQLEQEKLRAELAALRHQMHPHFLFNVLNALYGLALRERDEPTAEGIAKLSGMMRYMLYESNAPLTSLDREIDYLRDYIDLQRLRLPESASVNFEVTGQVEGRSIPPMVLAPFVENAFKHGISTLRPSVIVIRAEVEDKWLNVFITNTLHPKKTGLSPEVGGIGLDNVVRRLQLLFADKYKLLQQSQGDTYLVHLTLPLT